MVRGKFHTAVGRGAGSWGPCPEPLTSPQALCTCTPQPAPHSTPTGPVQPREVGQTPSPTNSVKPPSTPTPHPRRATAQPAQGWGHNRSPQPPRQHSGVSYGTPLPATHTLGAGGPAPGTSRAGRQAPAEPLPRAGGSGTGLPGESGADGRGGVWWGQELSGDQPLPAQQRCGCPCHYFWPQGQLWDRQPLAFLQTGGQSLHPEVPARTLPVPTLSPSQGQLILQHPQTHMARRDSSR